jgi:hypothetical protein
MIWFFIDNGSSYDLTPNLKKNSLESAIKYDNRNSHRIERTRDFVEQVLRLY